MTLILASFVKRRGDTLKLFLDLGRKTQNEGVAPIRFVGKILFKKKKKKGYDVSRENKIKKKQSNNMISLRKTAQQSNRSGVFFIT